MANQDFSLYRYTVEDYAGNFLTKDVQFKSDTEARVLLADWMMSSKMYKQLTLYKYTTNDTCGPYRKIDEFIKTLKDEL